MAHRDRRDRGVGPNRQRQLVFGRHWPRQKQHQRHVSWPEKPEGACAFREELSGNTEAVPPTAEELRKLGAFLCRRADKNSGNIRTAFVTAGCSRNPALKTPCRHPTTPCRHPATRRYFDTVAKMTLSCRRQRAVTGNDSAKCARFRRIHSVRWVL